MTGAVLRAGAWPAVAGVSGVAVVVGGSAAAFPAAATTMLPVCFALLAAAAAFALDEPASVVVDVTPTGPVRRTGIRAVALLAPLAVGALVMLAAALRGLVLPWAAAGLALTGNLVLGFAVACVVRTRTGEPGVAAGTAVVLLLLAPGLVPQVARWVRTFPASGAGGPSADTVWWTVLTVCVVAIAISVGGRRLPRWMSRFSVIPALAGTMVAVPPVAAGRLAVPADHVPAGRRAARISAGMAAAVVLAGVAGVALTVVARAAFKGNDLAFNLVALAAAVAYATLGALVVRHAGSLIGWLMLAESAGLVFMTLASTYCLLGVTTFPGDLPAARQAGTIAESGFASVAFILVLMLLLFPAGTLPSRRWRPVAAAGIAATALATIGLILGPRLVEIPAPGGVSATFANPFGQPRLTPGLIGTLDGLLAVSIPFLAVSFVSLAVRYRTGSWLLRQQIKWLVLTAGAFLASMLLLLLSTWTHQPGLNAAASAMSGVIPLLGIPAAISAAILRHHLYDIDRIISRTLSYTIVTGLLVGVYAGLVLLTTQVLSFSSPVAVAISALAAAALFSPLRNRVQRAADRRFNRARYNADQTLTAFAARLQGEVDIGAVRADLLGTVNQTLEPAQLSLWLNPGPDHGNQAGHQDDRRISGQQGVPGEPS
jgi:hypothetical protein